MTAIAYDEHGMTLIHGDSVELLRTGWLGDLVTADVVITDPPYGIDAETDYRRFGQGTNRTWPRVAGDDKPFDPAPWLELAPCLLWGANHYADRLPAGGGWLVWNKRDQQATSMLMSDAELAWHNLGGQGVAVFNWYWSGCYRKGEMGEAHHPTPKPVALMRWTVERFTERGQVVLDPYMGAGPLAIACRDAGRRYVGIELVREYVDAAIGRLAQEALPV